MKIRKAYVFRLKVSASTAEKLTLFAGHCRFVWNKALRLNMHRLDNKQRIMRYNELAFWVTLWKKTEECKFLSECHSQLIQQKLKDLDRAFADAFDTQQPNKRLPKPRKRGVHDTFRYPQGFKFENRRVYLPKIGWVSFFKSQEIVGTPKNVTIKRRGKHWYMSVQVEVTLPSVKQAPAVSVGIDLGVARLATLSTGQVVSPIHIYREHEKRLAGLQRQLARKQKFSSNWFKQKEKITKHHLKTANIRMHYLHTVTTQICKSHATIYIEDLKVRSMSASARGTLQNPGRNVSAKSGLNKSILDQGWYEFRRQLEYKASWRNGRVIAIDPRYTSQRCSACGYTDKANRPTQERFFCRSCNYSEHADLNAARNIQAVGQTVLACGEEALAASLKQEPLGSRETVPASS